MRQELIEDYISHYYGKNVDDSSKKSIVEAIGYIESTRGCELQPEIVEHSICLGEDELFTDIDSVIKRLTELKSAGYTFLWQNYFDYDAYNVMVGKKELETNDEFYSRIHSAVTDRILTLKTKIDFQSRTKRRIEELQKEINKLKGTL